MKKKFIIIGGAVALIVLVMAGLWIARYAGKVSYSFSFSGEVSSPLVLERNSAGIPLIQAQSSDDIYFGMGFLHAQDRYVLMEYLRAIVNGSSSSIMKKDGEALDRLSLAIGFMKKAEVVEKRLRAPYADYIRCYARGVNAARKKTNQKDMVSRGWTAQDVIAILLLKEWANAFLNNKEVLFQFSREENLPYIKDIIPENLIYYFTDNESECIDVIKKLRRIVKKHIGTFDRGYAFYVPAQNMKDKFPVTAFGLENELSMYPGWYPLHIHAGGRIIKGITHVGMPFIFSGSNLTISFHGFSLNVDVQDMISESIIKIGDAYQYLSSTGWRDFDTVPYLSGLPRTRAKKIRMTENGPILNDVFDTVESGTFAVTVKSIVPGEDYIISLFDIPFSRSIEEAGNFVKNIQSFPRVYLFTTDERACKAYSGKIPIRKKTDSVLKPALESNWTGMLDLSMYTEISDNRMIAGSSFFTANPDLSDNILMNQEGRFERLNRRLDDKKRFTKQDIEKILRDKYSAVADMFLPIFLGILGDNPVASARLTRIYFQNWRSRMKNDFVAPSIFHILLQKFMHETYSDELKDKADIVMEHYELLIPHFFEIIKENKSPLFDDRTTYSIENRDAIFDRAFLKTMRHLNRSRGPVMNDWTWGNLHKGHFYIPASEGGYFNNAIKDEPFGGSNDTLDLSSLGLDLKPHEITSLYGFFGIDQSFILMKFSYSTDPNSEFYYGSMKPVDLTSFHEVSGKYFIRISPKK